jgi:superfamily II RNA helicase
VSKDNLTLRGILATEVNESHSLLTAELYARGTMATMSGEIILTVLAAFINEKMGDEQPSLASLKIPGEVLDVLSVVDDIAADFNEKERARGIPHDSYWTLSSSWIEPVWRWLNGESSAQLCADYEIYEGNLLRTVLRVANVADEWISLATYCEHTEMVSRMTEVKSRLIREFAVTDSLYLRL